jgi:hypothetical protein
LPARSASTPAAVPVSMNEKQRAYHKFALTLKWVLLFQWWAGCLPVSNILARAAKTTGSLLLQSCRGARADFHWDLVQLSKKKSSQLAINVVLYMQISAQWSLKINSHIGVDTPVQLKWSFEVQYYDEVRVELERCGQ